MIFFQKAGELLTEHSTQLAIEMEKKLKEKYKPFIYKTSFNEEDIVKWRAQLPVCIGNALLTQDETKAFSQVEEWAKQTGEAAVQHGIAIDGLMINIRLYRETIWDYIEKEVKLDDMRPSSILKVSRQIDALLDFTAHTFSVSYVNHSTQIIKAAQKAFNEVSFPVVALSNKVAVLPLIGELNEERTACLLETILEKCTALGVVRLIVDLSGVPHVDTIAANQLFKLNQALNLIGVSSVLTGMRPELVVPIINSQIDFSQIEIKSTLKEAFSASFAM